MIVMTFGMTKTTTMMMKKMMMTTRMAKIMMTTRMKKMTTRIKKMTMKMKPLHATVLEHIRLGCLRLENNVEGERLQVAFSLVHLFTKMTMAMMKMTMTMTMTIIRVMSHPYLAFSRELND